MSENNISYYLNLITPNNSIEFEISIKRVDNLISGKNYNSAERNVKKSSRYAKTSLNWMSVLKRAYKLSVIANKIDLFSKYVDKAFKIYPGNEDIRAMKVYSLLQTEAYDEASQTALSLFREEYNNLKVEAALAAEFASETIADPFSYIINLLSKSEDPEIFQKIGLITGNKKLLFDGALLFMKYGELEKAYNLAYKITGTWVNDEAIAMIAIDNGEYNQALSRLLNHNAMDEKSHNQKWAVQLIIGDLQQLMTYYSDAGEFYQKSISINEKGSWHQYANYSRLLKENGRFRQSMDVLQEGIELFPQKERELVIAMVNNQFSRNRSTTERFLKSFLNENPDDPEANLLYIEHFPIQMTPEKYGARIWELYNKNPSNRKIAEFLLWYLIGVGDLEGTTLVLDRFDRDSGPFYWTVFYRALSVSMAKGYIEAEELLKVSLKMKETWYSHFNLAVIQLYLNKFDEALDHLNQTEFLIGKESRKNDIYISNVKTKYAIAFMKKQELDRAMIALDEALKIDEENLEAALLKREIAKLQVETF